MLEQSDVMPLLLEACPGFSDAWAEHVQDHGNDLLYVVAGSFAGHLLALHESGQGSSLRKAGAAIEQLHIHGSPWVKEFATIGLLEGIQNVWANANADPECFVPFLGPESLHWWAGLNRFWDGKAPVVRRDG